MHKAAISFENDIISVEGDLNFTSVNHVWKNSLPLLDQCPRLVFDLSRVTSANSAGLALLLEWMRYAKSRNKAIQFDHLPDQLLSIAKVSGIIEML